MSRTSSRLRNIGGNESVREALQCATVPFIRRPQRFAKQLPSLGVTNGGDDEALAIRGERKGSVGANFKEFEHASVDH